MLKNTEREAVEQQEKNEPGAVSKKAKEILSRPPKPERAERPRFGPLARRFRQQVPRGS